jgi:hypothetical protein
LKKNVLITVGIVVFFAIGILFSLFKGCESDYQRDQKAKNVAHQYYSKYNILLKGVIVSSVPVSNEVPACNYNTFIVNIVKCNVKEHDLREYNTDYYLVIKDDVAKFVYHFSLGSVGDSIIVDYRKKEQFTWKGKFTFPYGKSLPLFGGLYTNVRVKGLGS